MIVAEHTLFQSLIYNMSIVKSKQNIKKKDVCLSAFK